MGSSTLRWSVLCLLMIAVVLVVLLERAVRFVGESARQSHCEMRFNQMQHALCVYHDHKGHFPPAFVAGPDGKPWHSWRVEILPFIEQHNVYYHYRFDEPWDGPNNRRLADQIHLNIFQCPNVPGYGTAVHTNIVAIVGDGTAFPGAASTRLADFRDDGRHTILLAEYGHTDIHWMEPRDLDLATMSFRPNDPAAPSISDRHRGGPMVVFADRIKGYRIRPSLSENTLRALTQTRSENPVRRDDLVRYDRWSGAHLTE